MARHFLDGAGGGEDVIVGHVLVDRDADAGLQDGLYLRGVVLRKVHRGQSHLSYRPAACEEAVLYDLLRYGLVIGIGAGHGQLTVDSAA